MDVDPAASSSRRVARYSLVGAVLATVGASSCCLGPLLLALLGVGGAGALAALAAYRGLLLGVMVALLAVAFVLSYRPRRTDACVCSAASTHRGRRALWLTSAIVLVAAASPPVLARLAPSFGPGQASSTDTLFRSVVVYVDGIDCEACAGPVRKALAEVGGLREMRLDVPAKVVRIDYEPSAERPEVYVRAIEALGYEARTEP
ncbi:heavy metal-associated domain-containing protein [Sorangium sp. So ce295]|uniref:heavy-metal-associated domain-containing protein n=1 Tax=Sorangium sp. So ce295 TaxID=3133295 RepID=UPI003F6144D8